MLRHDGWIRRSENVKRTVGIINGVKKTDLLRLDISYQPWNYTSGLQALLVLDYGPSHTWSFAEALKTAQSPKASILTLQRRAWPSRLLHA